MKQNLKFILAMVVLFMMAIVSFSSCEKEEASGGGISDSLPNVIYAPVKGENLEWSFNAPTPSLSKGFIYGEEAWEYGTAYCKDDASHTFKTLKVYRRNNPDKYFYVMLTNLDIKADKHCWAYNDDERNVGKYGYLYTWMKANELAGKVYMNLPYNHPRRGVIDRIVYGRLMTFEDVKDILESDTLPEHDYDGNQLRADKLPTYGIDLYYDAFVGASKICWLPTYLTREDESLPVLKPIDFINQLNNAEVAEEAELNDELFEQILKYRDDGYLVILMTAGRRMNGLEKN